MTVVRFLQHCDPIIGQFTLCSVRLADKMPETTDFSFAGKSVDAREGEQQICNLMRSSCVHLHLIFSLFKYLDRKMVSNSVISGYITQEFVFTKRCLLKNRFLARGLHLFESYKITED